METLEWVERSICNSSKTGVTILSLPPKQKFQAADNAAARHHDALNLLI